MYRRASAGEGTSILTAVGSIGQTRGAWLMLLRLVSCPDAFVSRPHLSFGAGRFFHSTDQNDVSCAENLLDHASLKEVQIDASRTNGGSHLPSLSFSLPVKTFLTLSPNVSLLAEDALCCPLTSSLSVCELLDCMW